MIVGIFYKTNIFVLAGKKMSHVCVYNYIRKQSRVKSIQFGRMGHSASVAVSAKDFYIIPMGLPSLMQVRPSLMFPLNDRQSAMGCELQCPIVILLHF